MPVLMRKNGFARGISVARIDFTHERGFQSLLKVDASNFHALVTYTTPLSPKNQFAVLFIAVISYEWYSPIGFYFRVVKALPRNANW